MRPLYGDAVPGENVTLSGEDFTKSMDGLIHLRYDSNPQTTNISSDLVSSTVIESSACQLRISQDSVVVIYTLK